MINNIENLDIKINKKDLIKSFNYINTIATIVEFKTLQYNMNLLNIKDKELNFIISFLCSKKIIAYENNEIKLLNKISNSDNSYDDFIDYYIDIIINDLDLKKELFDESKYKVINDLIYFDINSVKINYRTIFIVLERFDVIITDKNNNKIVNNFTLAKMLIYRSLKRISQEKFDLQQKNKKIRGELAEKFVMNKEMEKLKGTNFVPYRASVDDISLGYDIESFDEDGNKIFIEVKTITADNKIFWTENESNISKIHKENYFIYAIKFNGNNPHSIYTKIKDPHKHILIDNKLDYSLKTECTYLINII